MIKLLSVIFGFYFFGCNVPKNIVVRNSDNILVDGGKIKIHSPPNRQDTVIKFKADTSYYHNQKIKSIGKILE